MRIWISDGDRHKNVESGYGHTSAAIVSGLRELGHEVRFEPFGEMDVCLFVCPPYSIRQRSDVPSAAYSLHELETLPPGKQDWPEILNRLDLLITATEWNGRIWRKLGVTIPVEVVPLGVDTDVFFPITGHTCTFLAVHSNLGSPSSREYWRDTLEAYLTTFTRQEGVRLVIKTWNWKPPLWEAALNDALLRGGFEPGYAPPVEVIGDRLSGPEMRDVYRRSWLFLKNADREGWSLPCTEAIACGLPIAATRIEPLVSVLPDATVWFDPHDVDALKGIFQREYARFEESKRAAERYPARAMGHRVGAALERLLERSRAGITSAAQSG